MASPTSKNGQQRGGPTLPPSFLALDSERQVVGGLLSWPTPERVHDVLAIAPGYTFFSLHLRSVVEAMDYLIEDREKIDSSTVTVRMRDAGELHKLDAFGGPHLFTELMSEAVSPHTLPFHARRIEAAYRRRHMAVLTDDMGLALREEDDDRLEQKRAELAQLLDADRRGARWPSLAERALALGADGQPLPTSLATLNLATRGGPRTGKVVVIGGAPGAGKTTLAVQLGVEWARAGVHVAILAADEDANGLLVRLGQLHGMVREQLEQGELEVRQNLARCLGVLPLLLVDADEQQATVDDVAGELARRAEGKPTVLIVDSIQTVRARGTEDAEPRARVDAVMEALKRHAKGGHHLVVATCELARGAYRSQDARERIDDLAAFKESGGVEYGATMAMVLRSVPEQGALVDVTTPKNRMGEKLGWRMSLDKRRATFVEIEAVEHDTDEEATRIAAELLVATKKRVLVAVEKNVEPLGSKSAIHRRTKGRKTTCFAAIDELLEEGRLVFKDKRFQIGNGAVPIKREPVPGTDGTTATDRFPPVPTHPEGVGTGEPMRSMAPAVGADGGASVPGTDRFREPIGEDAEIQAALDLLKPEAKP